MFISSRAWKRVACYLAGFLVGGVILLRIPVHFPPLERTESLKIYDRNHLLLREVLSPAKGRGTFIKYADVSPVYIRVLVAMEDKRFFTHPGIDPLATARALVQNAKAWKGVSGGSTITQQLIRNTHHHPRTLFYKLAEAFEAIRADAQYSKDQLLQEYLNRIPFGNNNFGIEAASRFYFDKSANNLTLSESAFLVNLPQSPTLRNPFGRGQKGMRARHKKVLDRVLRMGIVDSAEYRRAIDEFPKTAQMNPILRAPHFTNWILRKYGGEKVTMIQTTLDFRFQQEVEMIVNRWIEELLPYNVSNASVLVLDNASSEILAWVGSRSFWDEEHAGQVDGVNALRQPGSAMKPFTYSLALQNGFTPASVLADLPSHFSTPGGDFAPLNYDKKYHGPVRLRSALGCSYNIPAVSVLNQVGPANLLNLLHACGFWSLNKHAHEYSLGLTLGNGEVTLFELTSAFSAFAKSGFFSDFYPVLSWGKSDSINPAARNGPVRRVIPEQVAFLISNILSDPDARAAAFGTYSALDLPFRCSVKTGTSKDYKDNWAVGFTDRFTVGVWVGNFDGSPMQSVSGISGAAPIFHDVMMKLDKTYGPIGSGIYAPLGIAHRKVCPLSGEIPGPYCEGSIDEVFIRGTEPKAVCSFHADGGISYPPQFLSWASSQGLGKKGVVARAKAQQLSITFPDSGDVFKIDPVLDRSFQKIKIEAAVPTGVQSVDVVMDGRPIGTAKSPFQFWWKLEKGQHRLCVSSHKDPSMRDEIPFVVLE